jgi:hypothetical protein
MNDPNLNLLEEAVRLLQPLLDELVFVGGCMTGLLISDDAAGGIRVTKDVDAITQVASYAEYETLSERLRALGLAEDHSEDAQTCRWRHQALILDVMPTEAQILGFASQWYSAAIAAAQDVEIAGIRARVITSPYFVATKLEAFRGRGKDDYRGSHDLEDVMTVVDGRRELIDEVHRAPADVRTYIASEMQRLLDTRQFLDALPGFLLPDSASQARQPLLRERLSRLVKG